MLSRVKFAKNIMATGKICNALNANFICCLLKIKVHLLFLSIDLIQEDSGKKLSDINSPLERDKSAPKHTEGSTSNGILEDPKDGQASMKEPQKLSLPSDGRDEMVHETQPSSHEISPDHVPNNGVQELQKADLRNEELGGRRSGAEESDVFSFGSGRKNASFRQVRSVLFRVTTNLILL